LLLHLPFSSFLIFIFLPFFILCFLSIFLFFCFCRLHKYIGRQNVEFILLDLVVHIMTTLLQVVKSATTLKEAVTFSRTVVSRQTNLHIRQFNQGNVLVHDWCWLR
jgi:hypothetical protein